VSKPPAETTPSPKRSTAAKGANVANDPAMGPELTVNKLPKAISNNAVLKEVAPSPVIRASIEKVLPIVVVNVLCMPGVARSVSIDKIETASAGLALIKNKKTATTKPVKRIFILHTFRIKSY
jgi:hypothetical protein